jgi:hypothetical protein
VIGSTAEALVRRAPCPILTVKPILRAIRVEKRRTAAASPVHARSASGHKIEASAAQH